MWEFFNQPITVGMFLFITGCFLLGVFIHTLQTYIGKGKNRKKR